MDAMDIKQIAGQRIAAARKALNLKQAELAALVPELSPSRLGNYEQGTRYPDPEILIKLAQILGEPASYLGGLDDDQGLQTLARMYTRLDKRGRDTLHSVAESQSTPVKPGNHHKG
jgi:transcriptional regulator with XRE-family HTH domain